VKACLFKAQMLDRGIDMGGRDERPHAVERCKLKLKCSDD
jgi:hypothetical protein